MYALSVSRGLAWRSLILVRRMPSVFLPSLIMPLFILVATAGAFRGISLLPQFAGTSYLAFTIPLATVMGAGFAGINAGMTLARDIEGGFVDRLVASPAPRVTLILGPLTVVLTAGLIGGVGLPGVVPTITMYLIAIAFSASTACWAMGVAFRARTIQAAPLMQVVVFLSVFTSVAYAPREVLTGWLHHAANVNPVTYLLEASRAAGGLARSGRGRRPADGAGRVGPHRARRAREALSWWRWSGSRSTLPSRRTWTA
jgi:ABC-2 type transport system permease protein